MPFVGRAPLPVEGLGQCRLLRVARDQLVIFGDRGVDILLRQAEIVAVLRDTLRIGGFGGAHDAQAIAGEGVFDVADRPDDRQLTATDQFEVGVRGLQVAGRDKPDQPDTADERREQADQPGLDGKFRKGPPPRIPVSWWRRGVSLFPKIWGKTIKKRLHP